MVFINVVFTEVGSTNVVFINMIATNMVATNEDSTNAIFLVCSEDHPTNRRVLMQAVNSGVYVNFFNGDSNNPSIFLQFPAYVPIANGQWHHIAVTWSGKHNILFVIIVKVVNSLKLFLTFLCLNELF